MKNITLYAIAIISALICSNVAYFVQGVESAPAEWSETEITDISAEESLAAEGEDAPGRVTLIFKDADIRTVLHTLSYKSGINIVAASDVEGKVNIRLVDVAWETALEVIVKNQGLSFEKVGNIIRVVTLESVAVEELQNEIFILNYSNAKDIAGAIEDTLTERGKVKYDERTNTVIVTDIPTNLYKVKSVISRLDSRTPQIGIEAKIIETTLDKDENLGIDWTMKIGASGSKRPTTAPFRQWGSRRDMYPIGTYSETYDKESKAYEITSDFPIKGGLSLFPNDPFQFGTFPMVGAEAFTFGTLDFSEFSMVLELLSARTDTKIISNPSVTTLDNQQASMKVSTVFNIPTYERNSSTGRMEITGYSEKDVGIKLTVTPHVNKAGDIVVDLKPEVSAFLMWDTFGSGDNTVYAPRFSTRAAETQVMVRDGQTIVIGGLMRETTIKVKKKVPILGDIPILGELFKKTEDAVDTTDLLIFVTVRLIREEQDDESLMRETETKAIRATKGDNIRF